MKHNNIIKLCLGIFLAFTMALPAIAQKTQTFKGVVVDTTGEPIIGASVKVVGTTTGTITDLDGKFMVVVPSGKQVEISYIGYITQVLSDFKQTKIELKEDTQQLDEVVVVGYGTQKKAHLTGAIATVPMDDIQDLASGNLASTLSGMVNGLSVSGGDARPGENARINIRQNDVLSDIGGTASEPLYVIDGYIYPVEVKIGDVTENLGATAFNNLDPSVIESISVLKDAAAAVYGARAANGVILVTTKRGKQGAPKISYSGTFGVVDEVSRAKMLNAYQYGQLWNAVRAADPTDVSINLQNDLFQADELNAMKGLNYDLLDKYWKAALTQKHSINMTGGSERANYFGGISYFDQDGNLGNLDYNRWNYRAGVDVKISKWLKASLQVSGDYGKKNKPNVKVGGSNDEKDYNLLLVRPYYIPEEVNGIPIVPYGIGNSQVSSSQNYSFSLLQNAGDYNRTETSNMNINAGLEYDFGWNKWLKGLKLKFSYSKSINSTKNNQYGSSYELYYMSKRAGSGNHLYTPIQGQESLYEELLAENNFLLANNGSAINNASGDPYLSRTMSRADNYQMNFTATYNRDFGSHHIGALFSIEKSEAESEYLVGQVTNPYEFTNGQSNLVQYCQLMETKIRLAEQARDSVCGQFQWIYSSHDNPGRRQPDEAYRKIDKVGPFNYKGLVTPWEEPLDVYYMYRANYVPAAKDPMVYLVSHTWANRFEKGRRRATIEAYSNCDSVLLYNDLTNEKATFLGRKKNNGTGTHFMWENRDIRYNVLRAVGYYKGKPVAEDLILLNGLEQAPNFELLYQDDKKILKGEAGYNYLYRLNCGGDDYTDSFGQLWLQDNTNYSRSWAENFKDLNPYLASQRTTNDPIHGTRDWTLFQHFRFGRHQLEYRFPVADGTYRIELYFTEPWHGTGGSASADCEGLRIFDVAVNDSVVLDDLDIWAESGHDGVCKKVVYAIVKGGMLKIHFPEVKAGQALISGIAIASTDQELKPTVFPASGWSWEKADKEVMEKTPKELLPEDKNARVSISYEAEMAVLKGKFQKKEHRKQIGVFFGKGKGNSIEWNVSTGLAQVYALRFKYMNTTGKPIPVLMKFIDSKGVVLKEDILNFPETPDKWKMMSTTTGTFINAGHYKVLLSAENMDGLAFDALDVQ